MTNETRFNPETIESEQRPAPESIKVFRVRHGTSNYLEHKGQIEQENVDLTEAGVEQIQASAQAIATQIDKNNDIVWIVSSPRARTQQSASIIKQYLIEQGITVWDDPKNRQIQDRVRSFDIYGQDGKTVNPGDEQYQSVYNDFLQTLKRELPDMTTMEAYSQVLQGKHNFPDQIETFDKVRARTRNQLTYLTRIAQYIQPKVYETLRKRVVIVQTEHTESLEDFYATLSQGEFSVYQDSGLQPGDVVELDISTAKDNQVITAKFINKNGVTKKVSFDHVNRQFRS
jgi:broad specificity phosphatase PhoE